MGAYGDITCEWCGMIYHEQSDHECDTQDVKDEITRLEVRADNGFDGIECRDETIRMLDQEITRLRAENEALKQHIVNVLGIWCATGVEIDRYEYQMIKDARKALRGEGEK